VPWSVDYLDTKFKMTLSKPSPVVIVLSQLDDRYYQGLEGQYEFHLQFRLHKDDEDDYIVRSNGTYYMKRSVSTELDLPAGSYTVLVKIKATRFPNSTPEETIRSTCVRRREKLLSIGLSYDLAHAKGQFREQEKERLKREKEEKKEMKKQELKRAHEARRKLRKKDKKRQQKREQKTATKKSKKDGSDPLRQLESKLQDMSGLGISVDEEDRQARDDEPKPMHPMVAIHQRSASTGNMHIEKIHERSPSPSGFGGRSGYNKGFQGRSGYNAPEGLQGRSGYNAPEGFQGRSGYNQGRDG
jgi:hypothetical protein